MNWNSIEEKYPASDGEYLVCIQYPADVKLYVMAIYQDKKWFLYNSSEITGLEEFPKDDSVKITHWCSIVSPD